MPVAIAPDLTPKQARVLSYVIDCVGSDGLPPTKAEIARAFRMRSPDGAATHLRALIRKGYLRRSFGIARGLRILRKPDGTPYQGGR